MRFRRATPHNFILADEKLGAYMEKLKMSRFQSIRLILSSLNGWAIAFSTRQCLIQCFGRVIAI